MVLENANKFELQPSVVEQSGSHDKSFSSSTLDVVRRLNQTGDLSPGTIPGARIGDRGMFLCFEPLKDAPETREQRLDKKIKEVFGADVFDHLKDHDWLINNRKKLEDGFMKLKEADGYDVAWRMRDLSVVDKEPLLYLSKLDSKTAGDIIKKRYDVYLRRGSLRADNYVGQVYR